MLHRFLGDNQASINIVKWVASSQATGTAITHNATRVGQE